jgi:5-methyltetrahydropteroyltriglutamate--homocysteine methyltransferase
MTSPVETPQSKGNSMANSSILRAESVGSLLRPSYLKEAQEQRQKGEISILELKRAEDRAVSEAIALQEEAGLDVINDGEMRRMTFFDQLGGALNGLAFKGSAKAVFHGGDDTEDLELDLPLVVAGKISRKRMITPEEFVYARGQTDKPLKVTLPSPLMLSAFWSPEHSPSAYDDPFDMFADGAQVIREEALELAALGCEYIQIDAPDLGQLADPDQQAFIESLGVSVKRIMSDGVDIVNSVADDIPGVTFGMHLCRGNFRSRWISSGGYEMISQHVFKRATNYDVFLLEYDDDRSGSFEPLRDLAQDKVAALGLISSKVDAVESADEIVARIDQASEFFPKEQMAVSTQCGFASIAVGNEVSEKNQKAKLKLVSEVAERVWG